MSANIERQHSSEYAALTPARRIRPAYKGINVNKAPDSRFFDPVTESQDVQTSALIAGYRVVQDMDPNADFDIEALSSYKTSEYKDRCLRLTPAQQAEEAAKKKQEAKEARQRARDEAKRAKDEEKQRAKEKKQRAKEQEATEKEAKKQEALAAKQKEGSASAKKPAGSKTAGERQKKQGKAGNQATEATISEDEAAPTASTSQSLAGPSARVVGKAIKKPQATGALSTSSSYSLGGLVDKESDEDEDDEADDEDDDDEDDDGEGDDDDESSARKRKHPLSEDEGAATAPALSPPAKPPAAKKARRETMSPSDDEASSGLERLEKSKAMLQETARKFSKSTKSSKPPTRDAAAVLQDDFDLFGSGGTDSRCLILP